MWFENTERLFEKPSWQARFESMERLIVFLANVLIEKGDGEHV
jgi:hypothetical protein